MTKSSGRATHQRQLAQSRKKQRKKLKQQAQQLGHIQSTTEVQDQSGPRGRGLGARKFSEVLVAFGRPAIDLVPPRLPSRVFQEILQLVADTWNSATDRFYKHEGDAVEHRAAIAAGFARRLDVDLESAIELVQELVVQRKNKYADTDYFFGPVSVIDEGGSYHIMASGARLVDR